MTPLRGVLRPLGLAVILVMGGVAGFGITQLYRDIENLRAISQDNILWTATQMEVEMLRFQRSLATFGSEGSEPTLQALHERFDILWSRVHMPNFGRVGELLAGYDVQEDGVLSRIGAYMTDIDPVILSLEVGETDPIPEILAAMEGFNQDLRLYTLAVVRADTAKAEAVRRRMVRSAQVTALIGLSAILVSILSLWFILRDNARQREIAALNLRQAEAAEATSRAKSRFLTMMSHELRNPLNGILGPLALLSQSDVCDRRIRLIEKAQQSGRTMLRMLRGLLDYGDIQDERIKLKREVFRPEALADDVRRGLADVPDATARINVCVRTDVPEFVWGDPDRLCQIFVHLGEYMLAPSEPSMLSIEIGHDGKDLIGDISYDGGGTEVGWKLDLLSGMSVEGGQAFSSDVLGPLIARGLLAATHGVLTLPGDGEGQRTIRISVPAEGVTFDKIRVHLETRSSALETLYRAALRSDRVVFLPPGSEARANLVLVDTTSVGERSLMGELRARFPDALFVSLGLPASPAHFDDIVETPHDMAGLRRTVLGRLAS